MSRTIRNTPHKKRHGYGHVGFKGGMAFNARTGNVWCWCCRDTGDRDAERRRAKRRERQGWKSEVGHIA